MKKTKLVVAALASFMLISSLTGCGGGSSEVELAYSFMPSLDEGKTTLKVGETVDINIVDSGGEKEEVVRTFSYTSSNPAIATVDEYGEVTGVGDGEVVITVVETNSEVTRNLYLTVYSKESISGIKSFVSDTEARIDILGKLEKYAVDNALTGLSLYENGGYVMYNPRIQKGTETYISGYGFGIQREGNILADLASETKAEWKRYYHSGSSTDEKTINALNSKESSVSDLYAHISSSYWDVKMNDDKDGYDWYGVLAKDNRPIPGALDKDGNFVPNEDPTASSKWWKFHVRTGADGLHYRTLSSNPKFAAFDGRPVAAEDYRYGYELLLTQSFGLYRGGEHAGNEEDGYAFVGSNKYYEATKESAGTDDAEFAKDVHFKVGEDEGGSYIVCEMPKAYTPFYGMYYMTSSLYEPISKDFILALGDGNEKLGVERYGSFVESPSLSPVDTILSLGPRVLEYWEEDKTIAFKTNDSWFEIVADPSIWKVPGVKYTIYPGAKDDNTLIFREFLDGKLDGAGIPTIAYLKQYRNDPRTTTTTGDTVFKLNMNTTSKERWIELFGKDGIVTQTPESNYWDVKPWMSNDNFIKGLNASVDRLTYASNRGNIPSNNFFSGDYMADPENGISYNSTAQHAKAVEHYYPATAGYNLEASKIYFRHAVDELVEAGELELGTRKHPTKISLEVWWMYEYMIEDDGAEIGKYIQDAFNDDSVCGGKVKLEINHKAVTNWSDVYYNHLLVGQYDLGFGSVSGNPYDPLAFLDNLFQDGSSQFTLCWGNCDTSVNDGELIYDDRSWSFQGLWNAANFYANLDNGEISKEPFDKIYGFAEQPTRLVDGSYVITLYVKETELEDGTSIKYSSACLFATTDGEAYSDYGEIYVYSDGSDDLESGHSSWVEEPVEVQGVSLTKLTITFAPEMMAWVEENYGEATAIFGVDIYDTTTIPVIDLYDSEAFFATLVQTASIPPKPAE